LQPQMRTTEEPLTGLDSAFLAMETPSTPLHVLGIAILETGGADPTSFHRLFRTRLAERLDVLPMLRRQLAPGSFIPDGGAWQMADDLDLDWHLRRTALHHPGDRDALTEFVGRIAALPLDRSRPLWEMWLVEGLEEGRTALVAKMHHALVDGVGGAALLASLCDPAPERADSEPVRRPATADSAEGAASDPHPWRSPTRALARLVTLPITLPMKVTRQVLRTAATVVRMGFDRVGRAPEDRSALPFSGADTRINQAVTSDRSVAFADVSLETIEEVRGRLDTTVNDIVLAACTTALRRYLESVARIPDSPLVAAVPVAIDRTEASGANAVSSLLVHLPVDVADPAERLRRVFAGIRAAKEAHGRIRPDLFGEWADIAPSFLLDAFSTLYARLDLADRHAPPYNLVVSNVRGPSEAMRCVGARVEACFPIGPIYENAGLNITVLSYAGRLHIGAIGCPRTTPRLNELTEAFVESVDELRRSVRRTSKHEVSPRREPAPERLVATARGQENVQVIVQ
jgi:diacylglycerol O-acyltransferase